MLISILRTIAFYILSTFFGVGIATGLIAFMIALRLFPTLIQKYSLKNVSFLIENLIIAGAVTGNLFSFYKVSLPFGYLWLFLITGFGGIFVGCVISSLAEVLNAFPIIKQRFSLSLRQIKLMLLFIALGKSTGCLIHFLLM